MWDSGKEEVGRCVGRDIPINGGESTSCSMSFKNVMCARCRMERLFVGSTTKVQGTTFVRCREDRMSVLSVLSLRIVPLGIYNSTPNLSNNI